MHDTWSSLPHLLSDPSSWFHFGSHLGCLSSLPSCHGQSPFCVMWWFYQDGLPGCQLLLPPLHLQYRHTKTEFRNKPASDAENTFMVIQRLTYDFLFEDVTEVVENRHPCGTQTAVQNQSPVLPLVRTVLQALSLFIGIEYVFSLPIRLHVTPC